MSKSDLINRVLVTIIGLGFVIAAFMFGGLVAGLRMILFCTLSWFCVAFPEPMSEWVGMTSRGYIDAPSHPSFLRYAAWGLLIIPPVAIALAPVLGSPR